MVFTGTINAETRAYIKFHGDSVKKNGGKRADVAKFLCRKCKISKMSVYRIWKEDICTKRSTDPCLSRKGIGGRKRKVTERAEKLLLRKIKVLRNSQPNWCVRDLMAISGVEHVSTRTVQRILNRNGYKHLVARRKGILDSHDAKLRLQYAKRMKNKGPRFWTNDIAFYFDGVGFLHKTNPKAAALTPGSKCWRQAKEGLALGCTSKGSKCGNGGKQVKFFVAISHNCGVICAEQYTKLDGVTFAKFVEDKFKTIFSRSGKNSRYWLQDGDPSQNSAKARQSLDSLNTSLVSIPPRSPDLNPIENIFSIVKKELKQQAVEGEKTHEGFNEFALRVKATLYSISPSKINSVIESMNKRLSKVIVHKGGRIDY